MRHFQAVYGGRQAAAFVPCLSCGNDKQHVQLQLLDGSPRQGDMGDMGRIKGAAKYANAPRQCCCHAQTNQSRRGKKCVYKAASGDPASVTAW